MKIVLKLSIFEFFVYERNGMKLEKAERKI